MKIILISIIIIFISSCNSDLTSNRINYKLHEIRTELLSDKPLPSTIQRPTTNSGSYSSTTGPFLYFYNITRNENNVIDSIQMVVTILVDSLQHITFQEIHLKNDNEDKSYVYRADKNGTIDWAYFTNPPASKPQFTTDGTATAITASNSPIIEINLDSTIQTPIKKPDKETLNKYDRRLKKSVDELYKVINP